MNLLTRILFFAFFAYSFADDCNCRLKTNNRIVNGQYSLEHSIPWLISLALKNFHICGGSIINEKLILLAAHCIDGEKVEDLYVRVGLHNIQNKIPQDRIYQVKKIISYGLKDMNEPGDIAILELDREIKFIEGEVEKACFNLDKKKYKNELLAVGWGFTDKSYRSPKSKETVYRGKPDNLKHAFFKQVIENCSNFFICLKPVTNGDSVCHGDSGGPLHYTKKGITTVEGVASFIGGTEKDGSALFCLGDASYSRLSFYADWFKKTVGDNFCKIKNSGFFGLFN